MCMSAAGIIFPHQLFKENPLFEKEKTGDISIQKFYIVEDSLFFGDRYTKLSFHKKKLILHRASMQIYKTFLEDKGYDVVYIEYDGRRTAKNIVSDIAEATLYCVDPTDFLLEKRLQESDKNISFLETPLFINSKEDNEKFITSNKSFIMHNFYVSQRKRLEILIEKDESPTGGSWSFDADNRKKLPKSEYENVPSFRLEFPKQDKRSVSEAANYITETFKDNFGNTDDFYYPCSHEHAENWFRKFLLERFNMFGPYEDAFTTKHELLYHSLLSPLMNIGLLTPKYVVTESLKFADENNIPIASLEGFVRQIIGWREFMRLVYEKDGVEMRTSNVWKFENKLPDALYEATTDIDPLDDIIKKVAQTGYAHHIERLMVLGNHMFLLGINPDDVYRWFMEVFIDSYDWVMVPNIYAMSQFADNGSITTKPYFSGSNYIRKMSDYGSGEWVDVWDALYWDFVCKHVEALKQNGRMHFVTSRAEKFSSGQKAAYARKANDYKKRLQL